MPLDLADQCLDGRSLLRLLAKIKCGICPYQFNVWGFPHSSVGKESACSAGDPGLIPESGRSTGEGIDYPVQYSGLENPMDCTGHGSQRVGHD